MKTKILCAILLMLYLFPALSEEIRFVDAGGREVTIEKQPQRVAVLFSSFAEMWVMAGGEISITVGETLERGFAEPSVLLVDAGAGKSIDVETLIYEQPDFVIGSMDIPAHVKAAEILKKARIPVALFHVESVEDYISVFKIMTEITESPERYEIYGERVYQACEAIRLSAQQIDTAKKVLFIRSGSGYSSAKAKTREMHFAAMMLYELGAQNIADNIPVILDGLSFEEIFMEDPDLIMISLMGGEESARAYMSELLKSKPWNQLTAVKSDKVYYLPKEWFQFKPNHRWAEAYQMLYDMLYADEEAVT